MKLRILRWGAGSPGLSGWALKAVRRAFLEGGRRGFDTNRRQERQIEGGTEVAVMWPQVEEHQQPPELNAARTGLSPRAS